MDYKRIRFEADNKCSINSGILALIFLIYSVITGAFSISLNSDNQMVMYAISLLSVAGLFIIGPMTYGLINVIKINYDGERKPLVSDLFSGFKYFWNLFLLNLLITIYTFLWSLLFIIPGIIKGISYSRAFYIFYEHPEFSARECIERSQQMMDGHKWNCFALMFSYIGWLLLCILSLGLLTLWVGPKMKTADYIFYNNVKTGSYTHPTLENA